MRERAHFPGRASIDSYGNGGFRFAGMSHRGSIIALPGGISEWTATDGKPLAVADFDVLDEAPELPETLIIGTGRSIAFIEDDIRDMMRARGIRPDVMDTGAAVRTYNILLDEGRSIGAALTAVV